MVSHGCPNICPREPLTDPAIKSLASIFKFLKVSVDKVNIFGCIRVQIARKSKERRNKENMWSCTGNKLHCTWKRWIVWRWVKSPSTHKWTWGVTKVQQRAQCPKPQTCVAGNGRLFFPTKQKVQRIVLLSSLLDFVRTECFTPGWHTSEPNFHPRVAYGVIWIILLALISNVCSFIGSSHNLCFPGNSGALSV